MEYRRLGSSGAIVSTLAMGTMTFGTESDEATSHSQLDAFFEAGGNLIDAADAQDCIQRRQWLTGWQSRRG